MSWLGFPPDVAWVIHRAFRKLGHLTAYGLFAVLALRSVRGDRPTTGGFAAKALGIAVLLASTDETMQSFASERGGSALDVLLDACGAALALFFLLRSARRRLATNLGGGAR